MNRFRRKENEVKQGGVQTKTKERMRRHRGRGRRGQRWERGIIISRLKTLLFPLIMIIILIVCCDCLEWFCRVFIKPTLTISDSLLSLYFQSCLWVTSLCELTAYVRAGMHDNEKLSRIWIGFHFWFGSQTQSQRKDSHGSFSAARTSSRSCFHDLLLPP